MMLFNRLITAFNLLEGILTADNTEKENHDCYDEQNVDESADCIRGDDSQEPEYQQDDCNGSEHGDTLALITVDKNYLVFLAAFFITGLVFRAGFFLLCVDATIERQPFLRSAASARMSFFDVFDSFAYFVATASTTWL
ncbi:MAG: hypothetical protein RLY47_526 [Candidatus Parcubacteria bacterium]